MIAVAAQSWASFGLGIFVGLVIAMLINYWDRR
jgi:hypothetical protein